MLTQALHKVLWFTMVMNLSRSTHLSQQITTWLCSVSYPYDRLAALSGLAQHLQRRRVQQGACVEGGGGEHRDVGPVHTVTVLTVITHLGGRGGVLDWESLSRTSSSKLARVLCS